MDSIVDVPLFRELRYASRILIAGCGGGFDVYSGIPLALALQRLGKDVVLANLTFANPRQAGAEVLGDALSRIDANLTGAQGYFPEWHLARWLRDRGLRHDIYCLERTGVQPLRRAYEAVISREGVDAVIVVDGGTDSLLRGDEADLGTPHEDIATLVAIESLRLPRYLTCLGFGVDSFHGVSHVDFLENTAALAKAGAYLGTFSLLRRQEEGEAYLDLVEFATSQEPGFPSIVNTSIAAGVQGHFGDYHSTVRTRGSELFINPLMGIYWAYNASAVIERILYKEEVRDTETFSGLLAAIEHFTKMRQRVRRRRPIPL